MTYTHHVIQPQRALRLSVHGTYSSMIVLLCFCFLLITCVWSLYITNWLDCLFVCFFLSLCKISLCFSADEAPSHGFPCFHCDFLLTVGFLIHAMNFDNDMWTDLNDTLTHWTHEIMSWFFTSTHYNTIARVPGKWLWTADARSHIPFRAPAGMTVS